MERKDEQNKIRRSHLSEIFSAGVERVDPEKMIHSLVSLEGEKLCVNLPGETVNLDLSTYRRIIVLGAGKATARMAKALESILDNRIDVGLISVKYGHTEELRYTQIIEAGHPVPDENSVRAGEAVAELAAEADGDTLVISLISGGGSALLALPWQNDSVRMGLEEKQETTRLLLRCGATIQEINCVRKHISGIKGGRLAEKIYPATCLNLILSDVVGDRLDSIASGLLVADETTYDEALRILEKHHILDAVPPAVREIISAGKEGTIRETPKAGDSIFSKTRNILIGTNRAALTAAAGKARSLGYNTNILSSQITGEAREIAKFFSGMGREIAKFNNPAEKPACLIAGGETTVSIRGNGKGGRNQEMALSFLNELDSTSVVEEGCYFLSAGTDGNDGPTDAAGAFADIHIASRGRSKDLDIQKFLDNNDSYTYFTAAEGLLITGPTNTNVCDIQILLVV